jgi:gamma-glutamylcyclotransferase
VKTILNLAYGSNLHRARIQARVEIQSILGTVFLPNWGLRFHKKGTDGSGKCNLVRAPGEAAYGLVYAFSAHDKSLLDKIEGVGNGYEDVTLPLGELDLSHCTLHGSEQVLAYLAVDTDIDDDLLPYDWYHRFVRQGAEQCGFPPHYLAHIDSFTHHRDPDESRRTANLGILAS